MRIYKKIIIAFQIFLTPIALTEKDNKDKYSSIKFKQFNLIKKVNHHFVNILFESNKSIIIKEFWEERDLESQKRYYASDGKFFKTIKT